MRLAIHSRAEHRSSVSKVSVSFVLQSRQNSRAPPIRPPHPSHHAFLQPSVSSRNLERCQIRDLHVYLCICSCATDPGDVEAGVGCCLSHCSSTVLYRLLVVERRPEEPVAEAQREHRRAPSVDLSDVMQSRTRPNVRRAQPQLLIPTTRDTCCPTVT